MASAVQQGKVSATTAAVAAAIDTPCRIVAPPGRIVIAGRLGGAAGKGGQDDC
jgi:hypothetical protein